MNAMSTSPSGLIEESHGGSGSDSDTNHDETPEYYQPISVIDDEDNEDQEGFGDQVNSDEEHHYLSNGYINRVENGISSLHVGDAASEEEEEEEEEEERMREASDTAIRRAFTEDESRRHAPLTPENAMRVREAMRGVSFTGLAPDWVSQVPEDRWIDQLRRLRQPPSAPSTVQN